MGVYTTEHEITSTVSPTRVFKGFLLDADSVIAKVAPHAINQVEILEGNGGLGTIKKVTLGEGKLIILYLSARLKDIFLHISLEIE